MVKGPEPADLVARVNQIERALRNVANKTLYSARIGAGGLTVTNGTGIQFFIGSGTSAPNHADGTPQVVTVLGDEMGRDRLVLWDPTIPASAANQQLYEYDSKGQQVRTQDINGGWATPWFGVSMYPRFTPPQSATPTNGTVYGYATISTSSGIAQGQVLWEGRIPFVSHPRIAPDGTWGQASGGVVPTYSLKVAGTTVGTWTPSGLTTASYGPWDISSLVTQTQVQVQITVTWTGTGVIAADLLGVYLRQS